MGREWSRKDAQAKTMMLVKLIQGGRPCVGAEEEGKNGGAPPANFPTGAVQPQKSDQQLKIDWERDKLAQSKQEMADWQADHPEGPEIKRKPVKVKGLKRAAGLGILGNILKGLSRAGTINMEGKDAPGLEVLGDAFISGADTWKRGALRSAYSKYMNEGVTEELNDLIHRYGLSNASDWVKKDLIQSILRQREEELKAYMYGRH